MTTGLTPTTYFKTYKSIVLKNPMTKVLTIHRKGNTNMKKRSNSLEIVELHIKIT